MKLQKSRARLYFSISIYLIFSSFTHSANALTLAQFADICQSSAGSCSQNPMAQAYIGGALDLIATLDEKTEYLEQVYCVHPKTLFDMKAITDFMLQSLQDSSKDNAMLVLVRYFEVHGGCEP